MKSAEFVLDASLTLSWALPDEASDYGNDALARLEKGKAYVPALWLFEVSNGLVMAKRRGRLTVAGCTAFINNLLALPIEVERRSSRAVIETLDGLAALYALTAYDSAYLELALRRGFPLLTQDRALRVAATKVGVSLE